MKASEKLILLGIMAFFFLAPTIPYLIEIINNKLKNQKK